MNNWTLNPPSIDGKYVALDKFGNYTLVNVEIVRDDEAEIKYRYLWIKDWRSCVIQGKEDEIVLWSIYPLPSSEKIKQTLKDLYENS